MADQIVELSDEAVWRKIIGLWQASSIPGLRFKIVHEDVHILWWGGPLKSIPLALFMALSVTEILEILNNEVRQWKT